ncbi:uncharacterized protein LOC129585241 [Paramacrobiotus metropolitanus]|uniref:uncharacterized protein LOC129585241 n=1 Tax=Paramacrobiotus metropolitanus TaxID=2943436 RepID=UPI0024462AB8|nr:uncharacterized protein LOC129585241 [Paramacrobiotus metropolitanus]
MRKAKLALLLHLVRVRHSLLRTSRLRQKIHLLIASKRIRQRRWYVREHNRDRDRWGEFSNIVKRMRELDDELHFQYFRMAKETFDEILALITPRISHAITHEYPVSPMERLAVTLRILASGMSQTTAAHSFCLGRATVNRIYRETTRAIWDVMGPVYVGPPSESRWKSNAERFNASWQFPNCIGAADGKHVVIKKPKNGGSQYINYKGTHSIVLMAVAGPDYEFSYVDIGGYGRQSDGGTWSKCALGKAVEDGTLIMPKPERPLLCEHLLPHVFVADAAFPISVHLMRPYPDRNLSRAARIFNYRLSRARRVVENAFGILASRWRIFQRPMDFQPAQIVLTVKACVVLHNFLLRKNIANSKSAYVMPTLIDRENEDGPGIIEGEWRRITARDTGLCRMGKSRGTAEAMLIRDRFRDYFNSTGSVSWQEARTFGVFQEQENFSSDDSSL